MSAKQTFFWHDYETSGADPRRDRPMQFAGIRTDADLNVIGEPVMFYCRPSDDLLPHPDACLITGITPQKALEEGLCEADFIREIHAELAKPGTCGVGYNSIRFDDEVTRNTLYRNFYDPYAREWQNGCSRWDIIDMLRLTRALRPDGINWPTYDDGSPSLRLEDLTKANGIDHGAAHDALSDVTATIGMAKLVREKQPKLYEFVVGNRSKQAIQNKLDVVSMKPVLHVSSRYPVEFGNLAVIAPIGTHPVNKNAVLAWDLRFDPTPLMELSVEELNRLMYTKREALSDDDPRIALKQIHINKCPIIAPAGMLNKEEAQRLSIEGDTCRTHLQILRGMNGLQHKLMDLFSENPFEGESDPDLMIYAGGFFNDADKNSMELVRNADSDALMTLDPPFQDGRLEEMFLRYKARNCPSVLTSEQQQIWEEYRSRKLLGPDNSGHLTMNAFYERLNELYARPDCSDRDRHILEELAVYAESVYPMEDFA